MSESPGGFWADLNRLRPVASLLLLALFGCAAGAAVVAALCPPVAFWPTFVLLLAVNGGYVVAGALRFDRITAAAEAAELAVDAVEWLTAAHREFEGCCVACTAVACIDVAWPCRTVRIMRDGGGVDA